MVRTSRVRNPVTLRTGDIVRVTFDMPVVTMIHGTYGKYRIIPSSTQPKLNETWECEIMTTWENEDNRNTYPLSATVNLISKVV